MTASRRNRRTPSWLTCHRYAPTGAPITIGDSREFDPVAIASPASVQPRTIEEIGEKAGVVGTCGFVQCPSLTTVALRSIVPAGGSAQADQRVWPHMDLEDDLAYRATSIGDRHHFATGGPCYDPRSVLLEFSYAGIRHVLHNSSMACLTGPSCLLRYQIRGVFGGKFGLM